MARRKSKADAPAAERVYRALESHVVSVPGGPPVAVRQGDRLPASHSAVAQNPGFFIADHGRLDDAPAERRRAFALAPSRPDKPLAKPTPRLMRATRDLRLRGIALPGGLMSPHGVTTIPAGSLLHETHFAVATAKDAFEPVEDA